ncbi:MAG: family hydrolase [Rhodoglobus sp.]|nr:family hydrolase [Rhodoglobus sp.]
MLSVVLFDLDDTLFAHAHAVRTGVLAHIARVLPAADGPGELERWHELEEHHYLRYLTGELDFLAQRRERARGFVEPYGVDLADDRLADRWFDDYLVHYREAWRLHDDALPCLEALSRLDVRTGIITNGDIEFQTAKVEAVGLSVEHVIASGSLGFAKPDPRIFLHACAVFGVPPAGAAYVGDRLRTDALGAAAAGLRGVWIDRSGEASAAELDEARAAGVRVIRSLDELTGALAD